MSSNLLEMAAKPFLDLGSELSSALFYADAGAAELVHMSLGLHLLLGLGAAHVCELERCSPEDALLPTLLSNNASPPSSLAIFTTQLLTDAHPYILRAIMMHRPYITRVSILCAVSELAHACQASTDLGVEAYSEYSNILQQDLADAASDGITMEVKVQYLPMHMCTLDSTTFVLPGASAAAALAKSGGVASGFGMADAPTEVDGQGGSGGLSLLAHALQGIAAQLGCKAETFALGPVSQQLAQEVSSLPAPASQDSNRGGRVGAAPATLGIILVDRSLDLVSPCLHSEHVLDLLVAHAPRRKATSLAHGGGGGSAGERVVWRPSDLRADMPSLCPLHHPITTTSSSSPGASVAGPGAVFGAELFMPGDKASVQHWEQLVGKAPKDAAGLLRKWLKEGLRVEKLPQTVRSKAGAVQPSELSALSQALLSTPGSALRQRGITALALASVNALSGPHAEAWEAVASLERQVTAAVAGGPEAAGGNSAAQCLLDAAEGVRKRHGPLALSDLILLLVVSYSLSGDGQEPGSSHHHQPQIQLPFAASEETALKNMLVSLLLSASLEQWATLSLLKSRICQASTAFAAAVDARRSGGQAVAGSSPPAAGDQTIKSALTAAVSELFKRLHYLAGARVRLRELRRLSSADVFGDSAGSTIPLLRQLAQKLLQHAEVPDLAQVSGSSLRGLLTGLGKWGLPTLGHQARPKPSDCSMLLIFVVGGISMAEVREVRQAVDDQLVAATVAGVAKPVLLVGGTQLLAPADVLQQVLF